jgi:hypothetical protein
MPLAKYAAHAAVVAAEKQAVQELIDAGDVSPEDAHAHIFIAKMIAVANTPNAYERSEDYEDDDASGEAGGDGNGEGEADTPSPTTRTRGRRA